MRYSRNPLHQPPLFSPKRKSPFCSTPDCRLPLFMGIYIAGIRPPQHPPVPPRVRSYEDPKGKYPHQFRSSLPPKLENCRRYSKVWRGLAGFSGVSVTKSAVSDKCREILWSAVFGPSAATCCGDGCKKERFRNSCRKWEIQTGSSNTPRANRNLYFQHQFPVYSNHIPKWFSQFASFALNKRKG